MRVSLLWRGRPLVGLDLQAASPRDPEPDDNSLDPPMGLTGASGGLQDKAEPFAPDTPVFGISQRPESRNP